MHENTGLQQNHPVFWVIPGKYLDYLPVIL
jgi:hypothetical protein